MNLNDILEEVKYGNDYNEMKLIEDLLEDCEEVEGLEEGVKYFKVSKRLNKLHLDYNLKLKKFHKLKR